jgi:hypothetical protein
VKYKIQFPYSVNINSEVIDTAAAPRLKFLLYDAFLSNLFGVCMQQRLWANQPSIQ